MPMNSKSKVLLSLALLKEVQRRIDFYIEIINRNIYVRREFVEKYPNIDPHRAKAVESEIRSLEVLAQKLSMMSILLESVILRIETALTADQVLLSIKLIQKVLKDLKRSDLSSISAVHSIIEKLEDVTRSLREEELTLADPGSAILVDREAERILDEARRIAYTKSFNR